MPDIKASIQKIRLFLEGIEIPCKSFNLNIALDNPSSCSFQVVNTDVLADICFEPPNFRGIQPDTIVQAYFNDSGEWKQLFEGVFTGFGEEESIMTKHCSLNAVDMSKYWFTVKQYYLDKSKSGFPPGDYLLGRKDASSLTIEGQPVNIESKFMSWFKKYGLLVGSEKILQAIEKINSFYESVESRLNLKSRFTILENSNAVDLFKKAKLWKDLGKQLASLGGRSSIMQVLMTVFSLIKYSYISNPIYSKVSDTKINNIIFAPDAFIKIPPRCNVLFPEDYSKLKPAGVNFDRIPTRLTTVIQNPYKGRGYGPPKVKIFVEPDEFSQALARKDYSYFSEEEYYRGPIRSTKLNYSNLYAQAGSSSDEFTKEATAFDYYLDRYAHRKIQVMTMGFIPELIVGFPILILRYPKKHLLGRLIAMSATYQAAGQLSSVMTIDCVRRYNETEPPAFTKWFQPDLYDNQYIGRSIYLENLGFRPEDKDGSIMVFEDTNRNDYITAIENLCNGVDGRYDKEPNKPAFRKWFRDRHILTMKDAMKFIGAQPKNFNTKEDEDEQYRNATIMEFACDYRAFSSDFKSANPSISEKGPYISQRQEQMLLYLQSLSDYIVNL